MGAWSAYYRYGESRSKTEPRGRGIIALKKELAFNGYGANLVLDLPVFGDAMRNRVIAFQRDAGLTGDGVVGPNTAKRLFRLRIESLQEVYGIADMLLCKGVSLESTFDPGAFGWSDPQDRGLAMINAFYHPEVDDDEAYDPSFSLPWFANALSAAFSYFRDWDAAIASYNIGTYWAKRWLDAGKPASGIYTNSGLDMAARATQYVSLLRARVC